MRLSLSPSYMYENIQKPLDRAQYVPIVGVIPSALRAVVSAVQMVAGLVMTALLAPLACCKCNAPASQKIKHCVANSRSHIEIGAIGLCSSIFNIMTLGSSKLL